MTARATPPPSLEESSGLRKPERKSGRRRWTSEALFEGGSVVVIEHGGQDYVLRITRNGRLLLNKREDV